VQFVDLVAERIGGHVVYASDEFFADASNLLLHSPAEWREGEYTDRGKWMDGWESRRRRDPGNDFCLIALGAPGRVREITVETTFFRGNHPEACSILGVSARPLDTAERLLARDDWFPVLSRSDLEGDSTHEFAAETDAVVSHVRLDIFPDGGVARFRLRGVVEPDWSSLLDGEVLDLAGVIHGGVVVAASDRTFGDPANLLLPGEARTMGEGWETRRRRGPGHDRAVVRLGHRAEVKRIEICTELFKGNCPAEAAVDLCDCPGTATPPDDAWRPAVRRQPLTPDNHHVYHELESGPPATHARLSIYPDGGVARLRVVGRPVAGE